MDEVQQQDCKLFKGDHTLPTFFSVDLTHENMCQIWNTIRIIRIIKLPVNYKQVNLWHKVCTETGYVCSGGVSACEVADTGCLELPDMISSAAMLDLKDRHPSLSPENAATSWICRLLPPWLSIQTAPCKRLQQEHQTDDSGLSGNIQSPLPQCQKLKLTCQRLMQENKSACQGNLISMGKMTTVLSPGPAILKRITFNLNERLFLSVSVLLMKKLFSWQSRPAVWQRLISDVSSTVLSFHPLPRRRRRNKNGLFVSVRHNRLLTWEDSND